MHIIHIASEMAPVAKVGGLGDVIQGLSRELATSGHQADIIIPKYDCINPNSINNLHIEYTHILSTYGNEEFPVNVWTGTIDNLKVHFLDIQHSRRFFNRGCFYGCDDDLERFLCFSRCCLDFLMQKHIAPDIIHLHDWHTTAIAPLYKEIFQKKGYSKPHIVTTLHNISYPGLCSQKDLDQIGLSDRNYITPDLFQDTAYPECGNLLKAGIVYSDYITTVSPNYAKEVLTPEFGNGLEEILKKSTHKFCGILNGIDYVYWNPETDPFLPTHFSSQTAPHGDHPLVLNNKAYVKKVMRDRLMLDQEYRPIIGCISRLVPQKGVELIKYMITHAEQKKAQLILLGVSPVPSINAEFHQLKREYDSNPHIHLTLHHHDELAHMIYAASDIFIVPSLFEPCGLTQMIALRYGSIPVVRKTGGLADTIFDVDHSGKPHQETNGYVFDAPTPEAFASAVDRAIRCWYDNPDKWRDMMVRGMNEDFSWRTPAKKYVQVYDFVKNCQYT